MLCIGFSVMGRGKDVYLVMTDAVGMINVRDIKRERTPPCMVS